MNSMDAYLQPYVSCHLITRIIRQRKKNIGEIFGHREASMLLDIYIYKVIYTYLLLYKSSNTDTKRYPKYIAFSLPQTYQTR